MDKKGIGTAGKIGIIVAIIIIAFIVLLAMNGTEHYDLGETRYGEVVFTEGPATDYDQYVEKTDATYESDEDVWVYADIDDVGLILGEEEGTGEEGAWVQVGTWMTVEDDEGNTIIERTQVMNPEEEQGWRVAHDDEDTLDEIIETFHITYVIEAHELEEGDYELILEIEDRVSDDTDEWTGTFTVGDVDDEEVDETNTLTVDANQNGGQVNVYNGIDQEIHEFPGTIEIESGEEVTIEADPEDVHMNWAFDEWSGPDSGEVDEDSEVVTLTMDADKEFQVNFVDES